MSDFQFTRRHFFFGTLLAAAVPRVGFGSQPSLKSLGFKSYNEKMNIACIGLGMRGPQILPGAAASENIVALCDCDDSRGAATYALYPKATKYKDFRKMLDTEKTLDGVMVAVPDHWHTHMSLEVMQRGKHVYCEKPLTRTFFEAKLLADAAAKYGVATQMGNQGWNHEACKTACEIFWSGEIGEVREVHAWTGGGAGDRGYPASGPPEQPIPAGFDWDMWLGPQPARPYNADYRGWRSYIDFSCGGTLGDWLVHCLGPAHLALRLDLAEPISVEAVNVVQRNAFRWPASDEVVYEFPARGNMPPVTIHAYQAMRGDFKNPPGMAEGEPLLPPMGNLAKDKNRPFPMTGDGMLLVGNQLDARGQVPPRAAPQGGARAAGAPGGMAGARAGMPGAPGAAGGQGQGARAGMPGAAGGRAGMPAGDRGPGNGSVFVGSKGYMATGSRGEGVWLLPASRWADYILPPQLLQRGVNHQQDWIRACKGGAPGVSQFAVASKYIQWLALGAVALRVPGKLMWDGRTQRFTNNEEANKLLRPVERKGYELKI
jgi:predicted dehydrogenase